NQRLWFVGRGLGRSIIHNETPVLSLAAWRDLQLKTGLRVAALAHRQGERPQAADEITALERAHTSRVLVFATACNLDNEKSRRATGAKMGEQLAVAPVHRSDVNLDQ